MTLVPLYGQYTTVHGLPSVGFVRFTPKLVSPTSGAELPIGSFTKPLDDFGLVNVSVPATDELLGVTWVYGVSQVIDGVSTYFEILVPASSASAGVNLVSSEPSVTYTNRNAQDAVGAILASSSSVALTYSAGTSITASLVSGGTPNSALVNMAAHTIKGNNTGSSAAPMDLTAAQAKTVLAITNSDVSGLGVLALVTTLNGDISNVGATTTLATVNTNVGSFGDASHVATFTANGKGLVTAAGSTAIAIASTDVSGLHHLATDSDLTGDVTTSGSAATTIASNAVTNAKAAQMAANTLKGNATGSTTNATDLSVASAMTLLGAAFLLEKVASLTNTSSAFTVPDVTTATWNRLTLNASTVTFTFPTATAGKSLILETHQDATGSRLVTWPSNVKWPGGTAPTLTATASAYDVFAFFCADGTNWIGSVWNQNYS